jgi:hypothetical protein
MPREKRIARMVCLLCLCTLFAEGAQAQPRNQVFTTFDAPGAGTSPGQGTQPLALNTAGIIAGPYLDGTGVYHGFARAANGTMTTFDVPGAGTSPGQGTGANGVNAGVITGPYLDSNNVYHGYVRSKKGHITSFDPPGAGTGEYQGTGCNGINAAESSPETTATKTICGMASCALPMAR